MQAREVAVQRHDDRALVETVAQEAAALLEYGQIEVDDGAAALERRDEHGGADQAARRMPPARERFGPHDPAVRGPEQGLEEGFELPAFERIADLDGQLHRKPHILSQAREFGIVGLERVAAAPAKLLRFPQRHLGLMDESRRRQYGVSIPRHHASAGGQADGRGFHGRPFPVDGQAHGEQIAREAVQDVPVGAVDDGEVLLAAHASHHLDAGREARLQIASEPGYDRVAHRIAVRVVERPEIVDIDDDEAERTTLLGKAPLDASLQGRTIRQPRQRVIAVFLALDLHASGEFKGLPTTHERSPSSLRRSPSAHNDFPLIIPLSNPNLSHCPRPSLFGTPTPRKHSRKKGRAPCGGSSSSCSSTAAHRPLRCQATEAARLRTRPP